MAYSVPDICDEFIDELNVPEPVFTDSGNGAHLLYRIDLPNDQASHELVQECLAALDLRFTGSDVKVDQKTGNAARLTKLYGTLACKSESPC